MEWAQKRRWMVITVITTCVLAALAILGFAIFYDTPTCTDRKQNGEETGIDCGGTCSTVCSAEATPASVRFSRALLQSGRSDLIAYIDNPNRDAFAEDAIVKLDVYAQDGTLVERRVKVTLPANASTPVYIPGIADVPVQRVFASFEEGSPLWTRGQGWEMTPPKVENISITDAESRPRITATLVNQTAYVDNNIPLVATVFADDGSVVAASQTVVRLLPAQGTSQAVFTWNEPFSGPAARVDIVPLLSLPAVLP
jgi:hypothetical protein